MRSLLEADVLNHNTDSAAALPASAQGAVYERSRELLNARNRRTRRATKTGMMLGLGEEKAKCLHDARTAENRARTF